jgi:hypothetical protein
VDIHQVFADAFEEALRHTTVVDKNTAFAGK